MKLNLIVAMTDAGVIGQRNQLPWHLPEDLKHFKNLTMGHPIIMGRKTYESIGKPLPGRRNIVITRQSHYPSSGPNPGIEVVSSLAQALQVCGEVEQAFVIGGSEIFALALPQAETIYLTQIHHDFPGDAYFKELRLDDYAVVDRRDGRSEGEPPFSYSFLTLQKRN